jgi:ATP-dependent RNA helicase DeaD
VESLVQEFDIVEIAAAAVAMAHAATTGDGEPREIPPPTLAKSPAARHSRSAERDTSGPMVRLFVAAGRKAGIRPGDLVGAITGEAGVTSRSVGAIEIADNFSLVEVPESLADGIIAALKATMIRGKKVTVRRER